MLKRTVIATTLVYALASMALVDTDSGSSKAKRSGTVHQGTSLVVQQTSVIPMYHSENGYRGCGLNDKEEEKHA